LVSSEKRRGRGKTNIPLRGKNAFLRDLGYTAEQRGDDLGRVQRTIERWDKEDRDAEFAEMNLPASEILGAIAGYIEHLKTRVIFGDSYRPMRSSKVSFGTRQKVVIDAIRRQEPELALLQEAFEKETGYTGNLANLWDQDVPNKEGVERRVTRMSADRGRANRRIVYRCP